MIAVAPASAAVINPSANGKNASDATTEPIEVPVPTWPAPPHRLLRISAQQYNTVDDYAALADALAATFVL